MTDNPQEDAALTRQGIPAWEEARTDAVLSRLCENCAPGDVVLVMSNGGFDNLHERLLTCLRDRDGARTPTDESNE